MGNGKRKLEAGSLAQGAFYLYGRFVQIDNALHNGQAQAG